MATLSVENDVAPTNFVDDGGDIPEEKLPDDTVLIVGAGPVGLVLATVLAHYGVKSILLERNLSTTRWPKMDLTNARSMEQFRKLGLEESLRKISVPPQFSLNVLFSSGLGSGPNPITKWNLPSVDEYNEKIARQNDGTLPLVPYQRLSQEVFEAWLAAKCHENPLIDVRFGWKGEKGEELESGASVIATDVETGVRKKFIARYVAGADGANSKMRRDMGIPLEGGPVEPSPETIVKDTEIITLSPALALLIHFKSRDLTRLHRQGQFWHIFFPHPEAGMSGAIIAQDEFDTWTTHLFIPLDADQSLIKSEDAVYKVLGGMGPPYEITIDEVLVRSTWQPSVCVARNYQGPKGRIFLLGDSAHQNIPTGGYGMNMGLVDAFNLGWKLASVMNRTGGPQLLTSYAQERKPVAEISIQHSAMHMGIHMTLPQHIPLDTRTINEDSEAGKTMRQTVHHYYQEHDGENKDLGVEMGYRYESCIGLPDKGEPPKFNPHAYVPSTFPGMRAPHVFLKDGTAIFDLYGKDFTLVCFVDDVRKDGERMTSFATAAEKWGVPLKVVELKDEEHARGIWGAKMVLLRPDGHVSWRGEKVSEVEEVEIFKIAAGFAK